jgi:hypothetical protein
MTDVSSAAIEIHTQFDDIVGDHGTVPVTGGLDG